MTGEGQAVREDFAVAETVRLSRRFPFLLRLSTTDGIHQRMNPWIRVATNRRDRPALGACSSQASSGLRLADPSSLVRRRLAEGVSRVSSLDETNQWLMPAGRSSCFGCGLCRVREGGAR